MSKQDKPREFWINETPVGRSIGNSHDTFTAVQVLPQNPGWSRFIEYSAYQELKDKLARAEKEHDDLAEASISLEEHLRKITKHKNDHAALRARVEKLREALKLIQNNAYNDMEGAGMPEFENYNETVILSKDALTADDALDKEN